MQKVLRSLLHEHFPEELRVKIALLSRRRDIINAEKQDELFKLLREYNIEGITPLGSGTNRYAFKLNGFVIKVATDHDGIIDNLKEFKMAKRLYPHVTKIYEVSENGTLLVAEYIQPFSSYAEMYQYADKIREILRNFSSVYLIGDVGITQKNYANWGLRVGSDSPVCLDFAYVYDVSSELFICRKCKNNAMLVPDKDFVKLMCPAKGCGAVYEFSDIRRRIGNDLHRQEIGDLSEEGYLIEDSNVLTELTPERSNYLETKKEEAKPSKKEEEIVEPDHFELAHPIQYYLNPKEDNEMNLETNGINFRGNVVQAKAIPVVDTGDDVAFSGDMNDDATVIKAYVINDDIGDSIDAEIVVQEPEAVVEPVTDEEPIEEESNVEETEVLKDIEVYEEEKVEEAPKAEVPVEKKDSQFSKKFIDGAHYAVSNIGKMVQESMTQSLFFDEIKNHISQKKFYAGDFYKVISTAVYKAIVGFCNFQQIDIPNKDKPGTHRGYKCPENISGEIYEPTMIFLQRTYIDERLNHCETIDELMNKYHEFYGDYLGLQREVIPSLRLELEKRLKMSRNGIDATLAKLDSLLVVPQEVDDIRIMAEAFAEAAAEEPDTTLKDKLDAEIAASKDQPEERVSINQMLAEVVHEVIGEVNQPEEPKEEVAFSTDIQDDGEEFTYDDTEEENQEENSYLPTTIEVFEDGNSNVIRLRTADAFGEVVIPFYKNLAEVDLTKSLPSMVDDRNGDWDWLVHFAPMMRFYTNDPEKWLEVNENEIEENQAHPVILDELEDGSYVMGLYLIDGIYFVDIDGNYSPVEDMELIKKINMVILDNVATGDISHLKRTVDNPEGIYDEEAVAGYLIDGNDDSPVEEVETTEAEDAAVAAMFEDLPAGDSEYDDLEIDPDFLGEDEPKEEENNMIFTPVHRPKTE